VAAGAAETTTATQAGVETRGVAPGNAGETHPVVDTALLDRVHDDVADSRDIDVVQLVRELQVHKAPVIGRDVVAEVPLPEQWKNLPQLLLVQQSLHADFVVSGVREVLQRHLLRFAASRGSRGPSCRSGSVSLSIRVSLTWASS
jgi:hypothetical protein